LESNMTFGRLRALTESEEDMILFPQKGLLRPPQVIHSPSVTDHFRTYVKNPGEPI
jgi:hypothetical protein